jgi:hypothetical protein
MSEQDAVPHSFASRSSSLSIVTGQGKIAGWSIWESAGTPAAAQVRLWDNASAASGTILGGAKLIASGSDAGPNMDEGIRFNAGVYMEVVAGSVEGVIYTR